MVKTLTVPADYQLELAPDFPFRAVAFPNYHPQRDWMRVTREGAGTGFRGINHSDSGFRRYFKDHPDWAALKVDGTRDPVYPCYSHPGVLAARVQATQEFYDGKTPWFGAHSKPGPKWIPFEPTDIWDLKGLCWCERCESRYQPERGRFGKQSNLVFRHGVEYAAEIAKRWPDKRLCLLAYEGHMLPPDFDIPDNMDVQVCMMWSTTMGKEPYLQIDKKLQSRSLTGDTDWTWLEIQFEPPPGRSFALIGLAVDGRKGTAWFDDIELVEIPRKEER